MAKEFLSTTFHLGRIKIFLPSQQHPDMAEGITHAGGVGAVENVCWWLDFFRTRLDRAPLQGRVVVRKDVEAGGAAPVARCTACRRDRRS